MTNLPQSIGISLVEKIRADILTSRLQPGKKLTVKMLSELHACGASPVREALTQLASDGLVLRVDRRGFFVSGISRSEFDDILFNRCFLEGEALRRSIALGGVDWEEAVLVTHYRLNGLSRENDGPDGPAPNPAWEAAHKSFHMALLSACGSDILLANCDKLHELNNRYRFFARRTQGRPRAIEDEHTMLRDLALSRRPDEAVAALVDHYRRTGEAVFEAEVETLPPTRSRRAGPSRKNANAGENQL
jgi:GntR family transcriptional regulator, carbon starvation induced regulator